MSLSELEAKMDNLFKSVADISELQVASQWNFDDWFKKL